MINLEVSHESFTNLRKLLGSKELLHASAFQQSLVITRRDFVDTSNMLAGVSGALSDVKNLIPDISGGMSAALNFTNIKLNIFGCELSPNVATSDFYTFCSGGDGSPPGQLPSEPAVAKNVDSATAAPAQEPVPFAEPTRDTPTVVHEKPTVSGDSDVDIALQNSKNNVPPDPNALNII